MYKIISFHFILLYAGTSVAQNFISPCPNLFTYDSRNDGSWSGTLRATLDTELAGIWIKVIFDRPFDVLETDFGEAVHREPNEYLIRRPTPKVDAGTTLVIRITARYNTQGAPQLLGFRLNAKTVCPENGVIPPPLPLETLSADGGLVSPCPSIFTYEPLEAGSTRWYGNINVRSDSDLSGVWMRIVLDKPPITFKAEFGETEQREASEFLVKNPRYQVKSNTNVQYRVYTDFIPGDSPPKLLGFRLNGRTVCPENGVIEKPVPLEEQLVSPCPSLFQYEPRGPERDRWTGTINLVSDVELSGVWMRIIFDKPVADLTSDFGEVNRRDPNDFLVKNPRHNLKNGDILKYRITPQFNASEPPPKLVSFRLNARTVCPENGQVETVTKPAVKPLVSPCPDIFTYEPPNGETDKWYGNIQLRTTKELSGVWLRVIMDRQSVQLGIQHKNEEDVSIYERDRLSQSNKKNSYEDNWFGEVKTDDNVIYRIQRRDYKFLPNTVIPIRFFIKYNNAEPVPILKEIKLNGITLCPTSETTVTTNPGNFWNGNINSVTNAGIDWLTRPSTTPGPPGIERPIAGPDWGAEWKPAFATQASVSSSDENSCGVVATQPVPLVTHGTVTEEGKWPWHAALYYPNGASLEYYCGATIISLNHVLTVAHCVSKRGTTTPISTDNVQVFLGKYLLSKSSRGVQYKQVQAIQIHPEYDSSTYANDIALLRMTRPAEYTEWVRPVCLWSESTDLNSVENKHGTVVGWGYDNSGRVSDQLLKAVMPVVSHKKCIWSNKPFYTRTVNDRNFCAGFRNGTSVCTGDSGGGLVFPKQTSDPRNPVWQLRGLVSISVALHDKTTTCDTSHYVIFTDVAKFLQWIYQQINR